MIVVQKYGGSSVADVPRIREVARRVVDVVREGHEVVVVVSAMGNTTDELLALARQVSREPGRRELDLLVSVGERVSMTLLAMAVQDLGVPAESFTGSQAGIVTDDGHSRAKVVEVRPHRVQRALSEGKVAIVAGFQGVSRAGDVTTLGRGGSDTTAVVLAAALDAAWCEICSDVDGVYTADPRVVPEAYKHDQIALDGMAALARAGSRVLAAEAVEQARRWGVTLRAEATADPRGKGTVLAPGRMPPSAVGVTADPHAWWVEGDAALLAQVGAPLRLAAPGIVVLETRDVGRPALPAGARGLDGVTVSLVGGLCAEGATLSRACALAPEAPWLSTGDTWSCLVPKDQAAPLQRALHQAFLEPS